MKHAILFVLSALTSMAATTGCAVTAGGDATDERAASESSAASQALSLEKTSGTCSLSSGTSLTFGGATATGGQVFFFHTNQIDADSAIGPQGCTLLASLSLAQHFNLRITGIEVSGNQSFGPGSAGDLFTYFGLETAGFSEIGAQSTGGSGFSINFTSPAPNFPALANTGTLQCQGGNFAPTTLFLEPFVSLTKGTSGNASINDVWVYLEADPC